jgi:hypothetical protein
MKATALQRPVNNLALFMESEKFLAAHLGGRFQEGGSAESVARLKEITVDPKTVVLAKKVDAAAVGPAQAGYRSATGHILALCGDDRDGRPEDEPQTVHHDQDGGASWTAIDQMETPGARQPTPQPSRKAR